MANGANLYAEKYKNYQVIYDPWNSFTPRSCFTMNEIRDMLHLRYLAVGTKFKTKAGATYIVTRELSLKRIGG